MFKNTILSAGLIAAAGALASATSANASIQKFSGSSSGNASTVVFTFNPANNDVTVNIQNTTSSVSNIGQAISGISFSLANLGSGSLSVDSSAPVGYEGDSSAGGSLLSNSQLNNPWEIADSSGTFALGNPKILGNVGGLGLSAGSDYPKRGPTDLVVETIPNPNGSIGAHDPSLFGQGTNGAEGVTFTLDGTTQSSITSNTTVTGNLTVYFGTGPDSSISAESVPVTVPAGGPLPVPATLPLVAGGILALGALALRKRGRFQ